MKPGKAEGMKAKRMMMGILAAVVAASGTALGNVGVFRGAGQTPVVDKTDAVQLVEEEVTMRPREGIYMYDKEKKNAAGPGRRDVGPGRRGAPGAEWRVAARGRPETPGAAP